MDLQAMMPLTGWVVMIASTEERAMTSSLLAAATIPSLVEMTQIQLTVEKVTIRLILKGQTRVCVLTCLPDWVKVDLHKVTYTPTLKHSRVQNSATL